MNTSAEEGTPERRSCQPLRRRSDGGGSKDCPWGHAELQNLCQSHINTGTGVNSDQFAGARKPCNKHLPRML